MLPGPNLQLPKTSAGKALTEARLPKGGWDAAPVRKKQPHR